MAIVAIGTNTAGNVTNGANMRGIGIIANGGAGSAVLTLAGRQGGMIRRLRLASLLPLCALVAGCGSTAPVEPAGAHDPVMAAALAQPLLVDPDLSGANGRNLAIVPPGPATRPQSVP